MNITFSVENQIITRTDNNVIVSGSKNFLRAVFTLSPAWRPDHTITPIFRVGDKSYYPEMKNGHFLDENNSCIVPHEVLSSAGVFFVSVFDEIDNVRITANESPVRVVQSGYADAEPSLIPSPTVYDEILRSYGDLRRKVDEMQIADGLQLDGDTLHLTVNGVPIGTTAQLPPPVTVDTELSEESENPVQNKAVAAEMRKLDEEMLDAFSQSAEMMKELIDNTPTGLIAENETLHMVAGDKTIGSGIPFTPIPTTITLENNTIQLMAGQTKIGGGIAVPHMEVLNDITLTEDVTDITRAADDSGKPFKLKEFFLLFAGKCPSEANGVVRQRFNGGLIYSAYHRYTFPKNTDDTNRLLWFHSKKLFDGAYLSTYASQFIRDTDGNDAIVNGQIRCQGLINSNCAPHSDLYFRFPVENTAQYQTASSWQFGVTGDLKLLAGSRIIALGVRE